MNAQKQNTIWCFGDSAGIDFNQNPPVPIFTSLDTRGSCISVADSTGALLFYANTRATVTGNTTKTWNKLHQLMDNGDSIVGRGWYNELIIIPYPDSPSKYYLFSVGSTSIYGVYYSIIDMSENGGLGKVILKNEKINSWHAWDGLAAVKHGNGRDWWLVAKDDSIGNGAGNNVFHLYLITPDSIKEQIQAIGNSAQGNSGKMVFSRDGTKMLFSTLSGFAELLNFDRCAGLFSTAKLISLSWPTSVSLGSALSPNGNLAYISSNNAVSYLIQYDLTALNIPLSKDTIASISSSVQAGGALRLAPDNKIYWSCAWHNGVNFNYPYQDTMFHPINMNLSVINNPDVIGSGCNFSLYSFNLGGKRCYWGLPNNPEYALGPLVSSICDSLTSGFSHTNSIEDFILVYPNPFVNELNFETKYIMHIKLIIRNELGQAIFTKQIFESESINLSSLTEGSYFLELISEKGIQRMKVVKMKY